MNLKPLADHHTERNAGHHAMQRTSATRHTRHQSILALSVLFVTLSPSISHTTAPQPEYA